MAKIIEDVIVVKFSKIVKDSEQKPDIVSDDIVSTIEQVVQELVGDGVVVEVEKP